MKTKIIELLKRAKQNILDILPGLIICVIIAGISQVIAHFVPTVGVFIRHRFRYYRWKYTLHKRFFQQRNKIFRKSFVRVFHCTDRFHTKFN